MATAPCPFCGGEVSEVYEDEYGCRVVCETCQSSSGDYPSEQQALEAWSRREQLTAALAELRTLREELRAAKRAEPPPPPVDLTDENLVVVTRCRKKCCVISAEKLSDRLMSATQARIEMTKKRRCDD